ncbi:MAG: formyltetrahydrofolate deformylase, partial [Lentisphaerae bacterium]|nr:formyltetrahydrofolate deformylase [Lentisphaerota bacterium]
MPPPLPTAVLLISCPDQRGIVAALSAFILEHNGNIIALDQYVDVPDGMFFARMEWELEGFTLPLDDFSTRFSAIASPRRIEWTLHRSDQRLRMAVMVSRQAHCLYDILARHESGEWPVDIAMVLSNHPDHRPLAERHGIPFHHIPVTAADKARNEPRQIRVLREAGVDFIVLARYMQILSPAFVQAFPMRIINIHHSFLPAFAGAKPYHAAHDRGVKIIGATAHYVTEKLDEGPIIEQDVIRVSHRQGIEDLLRLGR